MILLIPASIPAQASNTSVESFSNQWAEYLWSCDVTGLAPHSMGLLSN